MSEEEIDEPDEIIVDPSTIYYDGITNMVTYTTIPGGDVERFHPSQIWVIPNKEMIIPVTANVPYFKPNSTILIPYDRNVTPSIVVTRAHTKPPDAVTFIPSYESVVALRARYENPTTLESINNDIELLGQTCVKIESISENKNLNKALTFYNNWMSEAKNVNGGIMNAPDGTIKFRDRFIEEAKQQYNMECVGIDDPSLIHVVTSIDGGNKAKIIISNTVESEPKTAEALCDLLSNEHFSDPRHSYRCYDARNGTIFRGNVSACANEFEIINEKQKLVIGLSIGIVVLFLILIGVIIYKR